MTKHEVHQWLEENSTEAGPDWLLFTLWCQEEQSGRAIDWDAALAVLKYMNEPADPETGQPIKESVSK